jgi:hypothetical protein
MYKDKGHSEDWIYTQTPSLKRVSAGEVAVRGHLRQFLSYKPLPTSSRWEEIAHIPCFIFFRTPN